MAGSHRIEGRDNAWVTPTEPVDFTFEGTRLRGCTGDTIASALAANGQLLVSRSFKYHRPRGAMTFAGHEANGLVQLPDKANVIAELQALEPNMQVTAQNTLGSLKWDLAAAIQWVSRFLPVGFYYRAFYWPRGAWNAWYRAFRQAAGLGRMNTALKPPAREQEHLFCDVLVVGGGPAGLQAALHAADSGQDVILADRHPHLGGSASYRRGDANEATQAQLAQVLDAVAAHPAIRCLKQATVNGWYEDHWLPVIQGERSYRVRAGEVIVCAGVIEQPAVFRNNDLPGILTGSAVQRLIRRYAVRPGQRAVVLAGNDLAYEVACDLVDAGVELACIVEMRPEVPDIPFARKCINHGIRMEAGATVYEAHAHRLKKRLRAVDVHTIESPGVAGQQRLRVACDVLAVSVGLMPAYALPCHAGAKLRYLDNRAVFEITDLPAGMRLAGAINGWMSLRGALHDGEQAAKASLLESQSDGETSWQGPSGDSVNHPMPVFSHPRGKEFVDFDEDLQISDITRAVAEGYRDVQLAKRFSTCGMGPSQGRHSALAMARIVARQTGQTVTETGVTTARPPVGPETLGHCAGQQAFVRRRTPLHEWHRSAQAQWLLAGTWRRPAFYGAPEQRQQLIEREVRAVRTSAGIIDVSTLGGVDVMGRDAAEFMDRMYTGKLSTLPVGKSRYALMTNETGAVIDDGVACRFASDRFYVTTTTGAAERIFRNMLWWQAQWRLAVNIVNSGTSWAAFNVAGPRARDILFKAGFGDEIRSQEMPFLAARESTFAGIPVRLVRVGFVGELGFEIHIPWHAARSAWQHLMDCGAAEGLTPFGVEAQRILRLEKGHVIVGHDTDAMSNPMELGMNWAVARKKPFFVGQRALEILESKPLQRVLVGFTMDIPAADAPLENQLIVDGRRILGRITSIAYSPTLETVLGLALVHPELQRPGQEFAACTGPGQFQPGRVCALPFFDPEGGQQEC